MGGKVDFLENLGKKNQDWKTFLDYWKILPSTKPTAIFNLSRQSKFLAD